ncbi:MAG: hypothetical protein GWO16_08415 [Gammaproteobacteria bacterium]|nr:hypothetical protein [Gammaproteobacteria bacterium]NIR97971.1 hypothetical protein [Gammaproteobacteria bacterium]NIT63671.1 hypothetical protein [Gammaproteobacteria bacterium]NIV21529.1 hypothetical protein [Gammaproteobacteria bacterium]NIY32251.1 hypothetical protein [Gammaproteobacteria bacterium]
MPIIVWWLISGGLVSAGAWLLTGAVRNTAEATDELGGALLKVAIAGGVIFVVGKKLGWIK